MVERYLRSISGQWVVCYLCSLHSAWPLVKWMSYKVVGLDKVPKGGSSVWVC